MAELMYWTGVAVWLAVACYVLLLSYHAGKGFFVAVDWLRWRLAINRASGLPLLLRTLPKAFVLRWLEFTVSPEGSQFYGKYGRWEGFQRWTVYPVDDSKTPNK